MNGRTTKALKAEARIATRETELRAAQALQAVLTHAEAAHTRLDDFISRPFLARLRWMFLGK